MTRRSPTTSPPWPRLGLAGALLLGPLVGAQACLFELAELTPPGSGGAGGTGAGGTGAGGTGGAGVAPADWWDEGFAHRQRLGLAGEQEAVDDAILPVFLDESFPYDQAEPAGADLRFVDADGTLLPYEIERWQPGGDSLLWVRVPVVDGGTEDHLWLYWGNPGQPPGDTPAAVWAGYESVVHMGTPLDGALTPIPNPGEGNDHEAMGLGATNVVEGPLGSAYQFDGGNGQAISALSSSGYMPPAGGQASLEGWFRWDGQTDGTLVVHEGCCLGFIVQVTGAGELYFRWGISDCCNAATDYHQGSRPLPSGAETDWHHYVLVVDRAAGSASFHLDGAPLGTPIAIEPGPPFEPQSVYRIGADFGGNTNFGGVLDEIRFANFAYPPGRIALHARAGRDEVISYGELQSLP